MKLVPLCGGKFAKVDEADFELVARRHWHLTRGHNTVYAATNLPRRGGSQSTLAMHVLINATPRGYDTDHLDGDGLNNTRANLRTASRTENSRNRAPNKGGTSQYKGVHWDRQKGRWRSSIRVNGRLHHVGLFQNEEDAAAAYDRAALHHFGEFARTNGEKA